MRIVSLVLGLLVLSGRQVSADKPRQTQESVPFEEPEIASAGELLHPHNSLDYGTIDMEVTVSRSGVVKSVHVIRDVASLTSEAIRDVKSWTFQPATLRGTAISSKAEVVLIFNPPLNNPPNTPLPSPIEYLNEQDQGLRFSPPQVTEVTYPRYPIQSVAQGTVVLEATVDPSGQVGTVQVVRDIKSLTSEADWAVRHWKFRSATRNGRQVPSKVTIAIFFTRPYYF